MERKVVYNACYGGYGLSQEALKEIAIALGLGAEVVREDKDSWLGYTIDDTALDAIERVTGCRHDPILVEVVERLGTKRASGECARLQVETVHGLYRIGEYDGYESVVSPEDYDWQ